MADRLEACRSAWPNCSRWPAWSTARSTAALGRAERSRTRQRDPAEEDGSARAPVRPRRSPHGRRVRREVDLDLVHDEAGPARRSARSSTASTSTTATPVAGPVEEQVAPVEVADERSAPAPRRGDWRDDRGHDGARRDGGALEERLGDDAAERGGVRRARGPAPGTAANTAVRASSSSRWGSRSHHPSASRAAAPPPSSAWPGREVVRNSSSRSGS